MGGLSFTALSLAIASGALSLARPVWTTQYAQKTASGVDIIIAMDISLSMEAQERVYGFRSRMDAALETTQHFIAARSNDRIGIVSFAGRPYLESAITLDHQFLQKKLTTIQPSNRLDDGTAIGSAINTAGTKLIDAEDTKSRIIILITDGSSNTGVDPIPAAKAAKALGIKVHTVAIGTTEGRVPNTIQTYPDQEFDTETLRKIANITDGQYYRAKSTKDLNAALYSIDQLEKTDREQKVIDHTVEYHVWFTAAALAFTLCFVSFQSFTQTTAPH